MPIQEAENEDARIEYIANLTKLTLRVEAALWADMIWQEDNQLILKDFLDTPATNLLFIYINAKKVLAVAIDIPKTCPIPDKSIYFLKYAAGAIPLTNFKSHFMHGTLHNAPLEQYEQIYEEIMVPILCNPQNNVKWPENVTEDIVTHVHDFSNVLYYSMGQAKGRTLLPIPGQARHVTTLDIDTIDSASAADYNVHVILNSIGEMVDHWAILINEILQMDHETLTSDAALPGPMTEIVYWKERKENLKFIFTQINDPTVKMMAKLLEKTKSCYVEAFKKLLRDVVEGFTEADDISSNLANLVYHFDVMDNSSFPELSDLLPGMIDTITKSWKESKYFRSTPSRVAALVQKVCNMMILKTCKYLNGTTLFSEPRVASKEKVAVAIHTVDLFVKCYYECRENIESTFTHAKLYPWEFPDERVFKNFKKFNLLLKIIQDLFDSADTFHLIPTIELKGVEQTLLKLRINSIFYEFCQHYKQFQDANYDVLDLGNKAFEADCDTFFTIVKDLDHRLGSAISNGCVECYSSEAAFQLMKVLKDLIARPAVEVQFKTCVPPLLGKVKNELVMAKAMHDEVVRSYDKTGQCFIYKSMPHVSGALRWAAELRQRVNSSIKSLKDIEKYFTTDSDAEFLYEMHQKLMNLLSNFEESVFHKWAENVDDFIQEKLNEHVIKKSDDEKYSVNYDFKLSDELSQMESLVNMECEIPPGAKKLFDSNQDLHFSQAFLNSSVSWYNQLNTDMVPFEKILIADQWKEIQDNLQKGSEIKWKDSGILKFSENIYNLTKDVFVNMNMTKKNINEVKARIEEWSLEPLYVRDTPDSPVDFRIYMTDRVKKRYNDIKATDEVLREKLQENLKLFQCDSQSDAWKDYMNYLESIMQEGLQKAVECSFKYILTNMDMSNVNLAPFIVIYLSLDEDLVFKPPVSSREPGSLFKCLDGVAEKIFGMASQISRMTDSEITYEKELKKEDSLTHLKTAIFQHISRGTTSAQNAVQGFHRFGDFWSANIDEMLEEFVLYGPPIIYEDDDEDEDDSNQAETVALIPELKPPTEEEFKAQIATFEALYSEADEIETTILVETWLILDVSSFKEGLLALIRQWIQSYKQKLIEQKSLGKLRKILKEEAD